MGWKVESHVCSSLCVSTKWYTQWPSRSRNRGLSWVPHLQIEGTCYSEELTVYSEQKTRYLYLYEQTVQYWWETAHPRDSFENLALGNIIEEVKYQWLFSGHSSWLRDRPSSFSASPSDVPLRKENTECWFGQSESPLSPGFLLVGDTCYHFFIAFSSYFCHQTFWTACKKLEPNCSFWASNLICRFREDDSVVSVGRSFQYSCYWMWTVSNAGGVGCYLDHVTTSWAPTIRTVGRAFLC